MPYWIRSKNKLPKDREIVSCKIGGYTVDGYHDSFLKRWFLKSFGVDRDDNVDYWKPKGV